MANELVLIIDDSAQTVGFFCWSMCSIPMDIGPWLLVMVKRDLVWRFQKTRI